MSDWTTIWTFRTARFAVELSTAPTGDYCWDLDVHAETLDLIDEGVLKLFDMRVRVLFEGRIAGEEYLPSVIWADTTHYHREDGAVFFRDMVRMACHEARQRLGTVRSHRRAA